MLVCRRIYPFLPLYSTAPVPLTCRPKGSAEAGCQPAGGEDNAGTGPQKQVREMAERLVTDIGGFEAGEVPQEEQPPLFWQRQLMAVFNLLWREKGILNLDEFRRKMEEFSPADYARFGFYVRRLEGVIGLLEEKGVLSAQEVEARAQRILREGRDGRAS